MESPLVNRVANSGLVTLNLEDYYPKNEIVHFDLKDYLFMELILKEKDFRSALKEHDWSQYQDKVLLVYCSTDAIIPVWAYMLVVSYVDGIVADSYQGTEEAYLKHYYQSYIAAQDYSIHNDARIVIKGCSQKPVPASAYMALTAAIKPYARSIMYGEPCSTVPIAKKARKK